MLDNLVQDLRYAVRTLKKSPGFTLVAILTLAVGIGATATVFSLVNGVLLKPLPYDDPEELVWVAERNRSGGSMSVAWANFRDWQAESRSFQGLAAFNSVSTTVLGGTEPAYRTIAPVSQGFWTVFPLDPLEGRLTGEEDHREGVSPVAVVSETFAREILGEGQAVGRIVEIFGTRCEVVGVVPGSFDFPKGAGLWFPAELFPQSESRSSHNWKVVGRLHPELSPRNAFLELDPMTRRLVEMAGEDEAGEYLATGAVVTSLHDEMVGDTRRPLYLLMAAAAFVLLVACTNLASTLLARGTTRAREMAVRSTLGASRGRIIRQLLSEAGLLALLGGVAGMGVTVVALEIIRRMGSGSIPRLDLVGLDGTVLFFTLGATLLTALASGLFPAFKTLEDDQATTLRAEGRGNEGYRKGTWNTLVATEVALAVVLLVGSGLLIRSFSAILSVDGGFDGEDVALSSVALSGIKYPEVEDHPAFWDRMLDRAGRIPGVSAAGMLSGLPVSGSAPNGRVQLNGDASQHGDAVYMVASEGAFQALDIPLLQGRIFDERDGPEDRHAVVVSRSFAQRYWPGASPLGKQVSGGGMDNYWDAEEPVFGTVVGVVADVRFRDLTRAGEGTVYWSYRQRPFRIQYGANLLVESESGDPALVAGGLREAIRETDPDVAIGVQYLRDRVADSLAERRFLLLVMSGFAAVALFLAALGIYGVVSYAVARRTREMGIRLALGATGTRVRSMVLRQALTPVGLGLLLGALGAWWGTRAMTGLLYEVKPGDPATFLGVVGVLLAVGLAASWIPAFRGTRVDPGITMRAE
ncbi:MAG: ABC transporter permease [Gemmatimonadota bacterium]